MPLSFHSYLAILLVVLLSCVPTLAWDSPLSDEAVREAYFLGQRHDESAARFLETYRRYPGAPDTGPHVYVVELLTPFAVAVDSSRGRTAGYSAQDAEKEHHIRGDQFRVAVHIRYTPTYGAGFPSSSEEVPGQTAKWKNFQIRLKQNGKIVECLKVRYEGTRDRRAPTGFIAWQEYDAHDLKGGEATVEVDTPDGQKVVNTYDLDRLR